MWICCLCLLPAAPCIITVCLPDNDLCAAAILERRHDVLLRITENLQAMRTRFGMVKSLIDAMNILSSLINILMVFDI